MRFFGRILLLIFGLFLAVPTGLLVLLIGVSVEPAAQDLLATLGLAGLDAVYSEIWRGGTPDVVAADLIVGAWAVSTTILLLPPALVAVVGEAIGARSFVWYGFGCGALTAALPWLVRGSGPLPASHPALGAEARLTALLFLAGAASGLTYWLVAGRSAARKTPSAV
ncbi:MAG TPA: hypothetical protein VH743_04395 [Beijerinckiaceae bacterium]